MLEAIHGVSCEFSIVPLLLLIGITTNATMGWRNTGFLGNPSRASASLREVTWGSLFQSYRAGQASWLKHTNHTASVLMNEKQRWLFVPERDCGWWEGTGTSISPGLYQQSLHHRGNAITRLFSHHAPLTILFVPSELLVEGRRRKSKSVLGPLTPSEGT